MSETPRHHFSRLPEYIDLSHGAGGRASAVLIDQLFLKHFTGSLLREKNDQAVINVPAGRIAVSTDSYVVSPIFFPGGNIGSLAVHGTINDVAMSGAKPLYLSVGFIIEEGFATSDLDKICESMAKACLDAGVSIVTGDTKVVERNKGDGVFINTTGIGVIPEAGAKLVPSQIRPGDKILVSGTIGDHGIAILSKRKNVSFETEIKSDSAPLHELVELMLKVVPTIRCLRDPTRGGVSATLNEIAEQAGLTLSINEIDIPIKSSVRSACEFLGIDALNVANEGKLLAFCPPEQAPVLLATMQEHPLGRDAAIIGEVCHETRALVKYNTRLGPSRILHYLNGESLPRIC